MSNSTFQIRFYKDINNLHEYKVVHNGGLLNDFKKERAQVGQPHHSFFLKKYLEAYFGNTLSIDETGDNSYLVIYEFNHYSDDSANIYEKRLRLV